MNFLLNFHNFPKKKKKRKKNYSHLLREVKIPTIIKVEASLFTVAVENIRICAFLRNYHLLTFDASSCCISQITRINIFLHIVFCKWSSLVKHGRQSLHKGFIVLKFVSGHRQSDKIMPIEIIDNRCHWLRSLNDNSCNSVSFSEFFKSIIFD